MPGRRLASCFVSAPASGRFPVSLPNSPPISTTGASDEVQRDKPFRALRCADCAHHGCRLGHLSRRPATGRPLWPHAARLASGSFRAFALCYYRLLDRPHDCALEPLMSGVEPKANDARTVPGIKRGSVLSSLRVLPVLATAAAVVL